MFKKIMYSWATMLLFSTFVIGITINISLVVGKLDAVFTQSFMGNNQFIEKYSLPLPPLNPDKAYIFTWLSLISLFIMYAIYAYDFKEHKASTKT